MMKMLLCVSYDIGIAWNNVLFSQKKDYIMPNTI